MSNKQTVSEQVALLGGNILLTTKTEQSESEVGIILPEEAKEALLSNVQTVVAIGPDVKTVKVGDEVRVKVGEILIPKQVEERIPGSERDSRVVTKMILDENKFFQINGDDYMMILEYNVAFVIKDPSTLVS